VFNKQITKPIKKYKKKEMRPQKPQTGLVLTLEQLLATLPSASIKDPKNTLEKHSLSGKQIIALPSSGLAFFSSLRQLDLSDNLITDLSPLSNMPALRHLNISKNKISDLSPLASLCTSLTVLDISAQKNHQLKSLKSLFTPSIGTQQQQQKNKNTKQSKPQNSLPIFVALKTIIVTDNHLEELGFPLITSSSSEGSIDTNPLPVLDTLVLSRNPTLGASSKVEEDDDNASSNSSLWRSISLISSTLRKLSLSDCGIQDPLPSKLELNLLHELRLAKNHISSFPNTIRLKSLQILDVSHNRFDTAGLDSIARFPFLKHLSVAGNPAMMNMTKQGDTEKPTSSKTVQKKMNEFLAFLYLFFKDLHTVDGKKFDREVVKGSLEKLTVRTVKVRVLKRIKQHLAEMLKDEDEQKEEDDNDDDEEEGEDDDDQMMLGHNNRDENDDDDDGANDPTIMLRRRRRQREDSDDDGDEKKKVFDSDDEGEVLEAEDFLKGAAGGAKVQNVNQLAAKALVSVKRRGAPAAASSSSADNKKGGNNNNNNKTVVVPQKDVVSLLQKAAANAKNISQW
jgi:Leucine-rich repeat (LRR) protein